MSEHTPIPWKFTGPYHGGLTLGGFLQGDTAYEVGQRKGTLWVALTRREADAEFITRACNAHEDLLAACEDALDEMCPGWCRGGPGADEGEKDCRECGDPLLRDRMRAAIAKAREGVTRERVSIPAPSHDVSLETATNPTSGDGLSPSQT